MALLVSESCPRDLWLATDAARTTIPDGVRTFDRLGMTFTSLSMFCARAHVWYPHTLRHVTVLAGTLHGILLANLDGANLSLFHLRANNASSMHCTCVSPHISNTRICAVYLGMRCGCHSLCSRRVFTQLTRTAPHIRR